MDDVDRTIEGPVTLVVTRDVKPKSAAEYEQWVGEVAKAARAVDENLSITAIRPTGPRNNEYVTVLHFSSHEKLDEWERSDERKDLKRRARRMQSGKAFFSEVTGFEYWFSLPKVAAIKPPRRYKMAIVTVIGLYMLSILYFYTLTEWLEPLPDHLEIIIKIIFLVLIMTYLIMPLLSRLFARWLYPRDARTGGEQK